MSTQKILAALPHLSPQEREQIAQALRDLAREARTSSPRLAHLRRIDAATQARLEHLMTKNTEGTLEPEERREMDELGGLAESLSLENARVLAAVEQPVSAATRAGTAAK